MNYALELSLILEKHLARLQVDGTGVHSAFEGRLSRGFDGTDGSEHEDKGPTTLEDLALRLAIEEVYELTGKKWMPWAGVCSATDMGFDRRPCGSQRQSYAYRRDYPHRRLGHHRTRRLLS